MTLNRLGKGVVNLALITDLRAGEVRGILEEMNAMGIMLSEIEYLEAAVDGHAEKAAADEQAFDVEIVRVALLSVFRKLAYLLYEELQKKDLIMEMEDLKVLKEMIATFFEKAVTGDNEFMDIDEIEDWDTYLESLFWESRLFEKDGKIGTDLMEKIAIDAAQEGLESGPAAMRIEELRLEIVSRVEAAILAGEMKKELGERIDYMCKDVFQGIYQTLNHPQAFFDFLNSEIHRISTEFCESEAEVMVHAEELRKISRVRLVEYDGVMKVHAGWMAEMFERDTAYKPGEDLEELWDAVFESWLSGVLDEMKAKQPGAEHAIDDDGEKAAYGRSGEIVPVAMERKLASAELDEFGGMFVGLFGAKLGKTDKHGAN